MLKFYVIGTLQGMIFITLACLLYVMATTGSLRDFTLVGQRGSTCQMVYMKGELIGRFCRIDIKPNA